MPSVLLLAGLLLAPVQDDKLGLTDKQILHLGSQEFVNRYTDKHGQSTADMTTGFQVYGEAVKRLNDSVFDKKPKATQTSIKTLRGRITNFRNEMCSIGRAVTGGGTLWNITYSETLGDVEDSLTYVSGIRSGKIMPYVVSDVRRLVDKVEKLAKEIADSIDSDSGGGMKQVRESLKQARSDYNEIVKLAAKRPRYQSDAILGFCADAAQIAIDQFGSEPMLK